MTDPDSDAVHDLPRRIRENPTGDAGVDSTMARLEAMGPGTDPAVQLPLLMAVHDELQRRLTATEV